MRHLTCVPRSATSPGGVRTHNLAAPISCHAVHYAEQLDRQMPPVRVSESQGAKFTRFLFRRDPLGHDLAPRALHSLFARHPERHTRTARARATTLSTSDHRETVLKKNARSCRGEKLNKGGKKERKLHPFHLCVFLSAPKEKTQDVRLLSHRSCRLPQLRLLSVTSPGSQGPAVLLLLEGFAPVPGLLRRVLLRRRSPRCW